jgi:hypothetical protein
MASSKESRSPIPAELERAILVEAGHRCAIHTCLVSGALDVHHIRPWADCQEHTAANLIALCPTCHRLAHSGKIDRKALLLYKARLQRLYAAGPDPPVSPIPEVATRPWRLSTRTEAHDSYPKYDGTFEYPVFDHTVVRHGADLNLMIDGLVISELFALRGLECSPYASVEPEGDYPSENTASSSFEVMLLTDELASIRFQVFRAARGAAHPNHSVYSVNFQFEPGLELSIISVLHPVKTGLEYLRTFCAEQLLLAPENDFFSGLSPDPSNYGCFSITQDGLLLTFQEYQVASYSAGEQHVSVPWPLLLPYLNQRTAVFRLATGAAT